jgi:mannose-6-phosphate isomerase-like protein (cupin superfamily)
MAKSGELLEIPELGVRIRILRTAVDTGGELSEFEVTGRPRGFLNQEHVHATQTERLEPLSGSMKVVMGGREYVLNPGDVHTIPPGTAHTQRPIGEGEGTVRITVRPAGDTEGFLEKMAGLSRDGRLLKAGWPRPTAAAELIREFGDAGSASKPPRAVQNALATGILASAKAGRALRERAAG